MTIMSLAPTKLRCTTTPAIKMFNADSTKSWDIHWEGTAFSHQHILSEVNRWFHCKKRANKFPTTHCTKILIFCSIYLYKIQKSNQRCIHESALYYTALIPNQLCIRQRWIRISAVWYSLDSVLALYPTTLISVFKGMFLPDHFSFEAISAVSDSTDSESALIHDFYFLIRISPRIRNRIQKYFRVWIRGPYGVNLWKKQWSKISCYCPFKAHGQLSLN